MARGWPRQLQARSCFRNLICPQVLLLPPLPWRRLLHRLRCLGVQFLEVKKMSSLLHLVVGLWLGALLVVGLRLLLTHWLLSRSREKQREARRIKGRSLVGVSPDRSSLTRRP